MKWRGAHDALHTRCRTVINSWAIALGLPVLLGVLYRLYALTHTRIQTPLFSAIAVALVGLVTLSIAAGLALPLLAGAARLLERTARHRPRLAVLTRPDLHRVAATLVGLGGLLTFWNITT